MTILKEIKKMFPNLKIEVTDTWSEKLRASITKLDIGGIPVFIPFKMSDVEATFADSSRGLFIMRSVHSQIDLYVREAVYA